MNEQKVIVGFIIATLLILGGGVWILSKASSPQVVASVEAKLVAEEKTFDWGQIPYSGGDATKTFTIKNNGNGVLKLFNIKTSCACTQAQVNIDGVNSPYFGMHTTSGWMGEVQPGKEAQLKVIFDPDFHGPSGVGPVERLVVAETNDVTSPKIEFSLKGVVVK